MPNTKVNHESTGTARINPGEPFEVRYWAKRFNVSQTELLRTIRSVGASAAAVRLELESKSTPPPQMRRRATD